MKTALYYSFFFCLFFFFTSCEEKRTISKSYKIVWKTSGKDQSKEFSKENTTNSFYKYRVASKVFNDLFQAKGYLGMLAPKFVMTDSEKSAALFEPDTKRIILEVKAYDICTTFGKDSLNMLASLLAHELTHYYEKHDFSSAFAKADDVTERSSKMERIYKMEEKEEKEIEADWLGGLLAFTAGYDPFEMMPQFLRKVYSAYGLENELDGYPSLENRIQFAQIAQENLSELIDVFETANLLTGLGKYHEARAYYEHIAEFYNSREIFNNLGVISCLSALECFDKQEMPFLLPIELDTQSRLKRNPRGVIGERVEKRNILLEEAILFFKQAANLDPNYTVAELNLGCAFALLGDVRTARFHATNVLETNKKESVSEKLVSDSYVLLGILNTLDHDTQAAKDAFENAIRLNNSKLAILNTEILKGVSVSHIASFKADQDIVFQEESIDNIFLGDFLTNGINSDNEISINSDIQLYTKSYLNSKVLIHHSDRPLVLVHLTGNKYKKSSAKGIKINDHETDIFRLYGNPTKEINLSTGQMLLYPSINLIFIIGNNGRIKSWCIYYMNDE